MHLHHACSCGACPLDYDGVDQDEELPAQPAGTESALVPPEAEPGSVTIRLRTLAPLPLLASLACLVCLVPSLVIGGVAGFGIASLGPDEWIEFGAAAGVGVISGGLATLVLGRWAGQGHMFGCGCAK